MIAMRKSNYQNNRTGVRETVNEKMVKIGVTKKNA